MPADVFAMLNIYRHYRNGVLPVAGGLFDQTAWFAAAMLELERLLSDEAKNRGQS